MPQLHFYVPEDVARKIRQRARARRIPVSRLVAEIVRKEIGDLGWPQGYFETFFGGWKGEPLERPPQGDFEEPDAHPPASRDHSRKRS